MTNDNSRNYIELNNCVCCGSGDLMSFLDLGEQPLANNYHSNTGEKGGESYPLALNVCKICKHTQLTISVDPEILFAHYLYVTGTNNTIKEYSKLFANMVTADQAGQVAGTVLDIACNDGTQLDYFKELGWETYGVDPAKNLAALSKDRGHTITVDFWPINLERKFNVITAQNVCAHTPDPLGFLQGVAAHLEYDGSAYIQTSQSQMYQRNEFDTVYHEHISFFNVYSMSVLAKRAGLILTDVKIGDIHGDSYIFVLRHQGDIRNAVINKIGEEIKDGRYGLEFYNDFGYAAEEVLDNLVRVINGYRSINKNIKIVGYGAAAKGMTLLNTENIQLDWIVDDNPIKQGLFTPGTNIEIKGRASLDTDDKMIIIPLAWNFFEEIKANVEEIRSVDKTTYIKYFPNIEII